MATVTGMTAERMLAIEAASVVDGDVDASGNLILTKHDGSQINAGSVVGPVGPQGPVGSDLVVLNAISVSNVGIINQIRAGRQLTAADFTNMGLLAPVGLWNLSDLSDVSGNGRNLLNKGAVPFAAGINGIANTAAQFVGSAAQALYSADTGAADPLRIRTGSFGCWFRTAKKATFGMLVDKYGNIPNQCYSLFVTTVDTVRFGYSSDGTANAQLDSISTVTDDRWHFVVATFDNSSAKIYIDGILEAVNMATTVPPIAWTGSAVFNIGARGADGATAGVYPHFGRIDEVFVTADVLSDDQIRNLYCAKIPHTLAVVPSRVSLNVRRRRKNSTLVVADFTAQPLRLHNFSGGSLGDEGSGGVVLTNNGGAIIVGGVDGSTGNAFSFWGTQSLSSTDAGLPSALATRSFGCWLKTISGAAMFGIMGWGTTATGDARITLNGTNGMIRFASGADFLDGVTFVNDGQWHHVVVVEDNAAVDGIKRKLYIDGRLSGVSTVLNAVVLAGAGHFRIGAAPDGTLPINCATIDGVFVCGYALTSDDVIKMYAKGSQALTPSPKNVGDHIEAMDAANILATFDSLESQHQVDLRVAV